MSIYVKIDRATGAELERRDLDNPARALGKPIVWLPLVQDKPPAFDPDAQKLVATRTLPPGLADLAMPVDPAAQVTDGWNVVLLDAAELANMKAAKLAATDAGIIRGIEDVVAALLAKNVLFKADLPEPLLAKINTRRDLRGEAAL